MRHMLNDEIEELRELALVAHGKMGGTWQVRGVGVICNEDLERVVAAYLAKVSPIAVAELAGKALRMLKALEEAPKLAAQKPAIDGFFFRNAGRHFQEAQPQGERLRLHRASGHHQATRLYVMEKRDQISRFFKASDIWPDDPACCLIRVHLKLLERLDELRERIGSSFRVVDGYRTPTLNGRISRRGFTHVDGLAAHVTCSPDRSAQLCQLADKLFPDGGVGIIRSRQYVHVDVSGTRTRWDG